MNARSISRFVIAVAVIVSATTNVAAAQRATSANRTSPDWAAFDTYVAQAARDWKTPGMAIAIVQGDSLVFARGYGLREVGTTNRVDEHTRFAIGSTTKAMTSMGLAMLVEEGKLRFDDRIVDAACMHLVMHPERLDVLLLPNLYGDIVSDLCAGLVGGLGVVPAANLGLNGVGVFEAVHGSAPDIAGKDIANPTALLLSAVLMLQHMQLDAKADAIMTALKKVLASGHVTPDLGGPATTTSFADAICHELSSK